MMKFLAMKIDAYLLYFLYSAKRSPRNTPLTARIWNVFRNADVHFRDFQLPRYGCLIFISCNGDSKKLMQTKEIMASSKSL